MCTSYGFTGRRATPRLPGAVGCHTNGNKIAAGSRHCSTLNGVQSFAELYVYPHDTLKYRREHFCTGMNVQHQCMDDHQSLGQVSFSVMMTTPGAVR